MRLTVRLVPRGGGDRVDGATPSGALRARVAAPAADGAANRALAALLAEQLGVAKGSVTIEHGATSRTKRIRVDGVSATAVSSLWPGVAVDDVR